MVKIISSLFCECVLKKEIQNHFYWTTDEDYIYMVNCECGTTREIGYIYTYKRWMHHQRMILKFYHENLRLFLAR